MKILNLHFRNINSLEGENRIDFERPPFTDTGVFAITGPNGSGKSSILDAITLGLYGETFRFDRPASFVMTQRTTDCFSVIEFALANQKYRSNWRVQREGNLPDGELLPAEMELIQLSDGKILASGVQNVCQAIFDITGMSFSNFTRAILLAQGNFAAFLNALDSERMAILENILGTDIYADYKQQALERASTAQARIDSLNEQLADIPLLPAENLEAREHDLQDYQAQAESLQKEKKALQYQQETQFRIAGLTEQLEWQKKDCQNTENQLKISQEVLAKIDSIAMAADFTHALDELSKNEQNTQRARLDLSALRDELQQIKLRIGNHRIPEGGDLKSFDAQMQAIAEIRGQVNGLSANQQSESSLWQSLGTQIAEKKQALATTDDWLKNHANDEILLSRFPDTAQLKTLRTDLAVLTEQQASLAKASKQTSGSLQSNTSTLDKTQQKVQALEQQIKQAEQQLLDLIPGKTFTELEALAQEQQQRVQEFSQLNQLAAVYNNVAGSSGFLGLFASKQEPLPDPETLTAELTHLQLELKREKNIGLALEEAVLRESLVKKMDADRHHLAEGKPCPLCGALQHPYAKRPPVMADSVQALADQHIKIKNLSSRIASIEKTLVLSKKQQDKQKDKNIRIQQIQAEWTILSNRLNVAETHLNIDSLAKIKRLLQTENEDLKNITALLKQHRSQQTHIEKLKIQLAKNAELLAQLQSTNQQLDTDWQARRAEQIQIDTELLNCQQKEQALTAEVAEQLLQIGEHMPPSGQEDALFDRLSQRKQAYLDYSARHTQLSQDLAVLIAKQATCQTEIDQYNQQLGVATGKLQQEELIGLHLSVTEKQKLIADKELFVLQHEATGHALQHDLQARLQNSLFEDLNALTSALELLATQPKEQKKHSDLVEKLAKKTAEYNQLTQQLANEKATGAQLPQPEQLAIAYKANAEQLTLAQMEIQRLQKLVQEQKQLQKQVNALHSELDKQMALAQPHLEEAERIRTESGLALRKRVQNQITDRLMTQTNAVLEKISGRYYLRQAPSDHGLALEVEDTLQGSVRRQPKTLSGGESFVVSLALALGLSEMASNGKSVESLFLDEGFGSLDSETLFTVITTLERLHTHGKMVGVISHVDVVKKRFKAQLQVVKKPNGLGALKKAS